MRPREPGEERGAERGHRKGVSGQEPAARPHWWPGHEGHLRPTPRPSPRAVGASRWWRRQGWGVRGGRRGWHWRPEAGPWGALLAPSAGSWGGVTPVLVTHRAAQAGPAGCWSVLPDRPEDPNPRPTWDAGSKATSPLSASVPGGQTLAPGLPAPGRGVGGGCIRASEGRAAQPPLPLLPCSQQPRRRRIINISRASIRGGGGEAAAAVLAPAPATAPRDTQPPALPTPWTSSRKASPSPKRAWWAPWRRPSKG